MGPKTKTAEAEDAKTASNFLSSFITTGRQEDKKQFAEIVNANGVKTFQDELRKAVRADPVIGPLINAIVEFNKSKNKKAETNLNPLLAAIENCNNFFNNLASLNDNELTKQVRDLIESYGSDFIVLMHKNREGIANQKEREVIMAFKELGLSNLIFEIDITRDMLDGLKKAIDK